MNWVGLILWLDLVRLTRRRRPFVLRILYAIILSVFVVLHYPFWYERLSVKNMVTVGERTFIDFMCLQYVIAVVLTPAYVGGALADEKQRHTLTFLLMTPMSHGEIVLGKFIARLGQLLLLLLTGLPVLSLLQLFGGIDPVLLWRGFALTFSTALLIGSYAMWQSVRARRSVEAIVNTYVLLGVLSCWIFLPLSHFVGRPWDIERLGWFIGAELLTSGLLLFLAIRDLRRESVTMREPKVHLLLRLVQWVFKEDPLSERMTMSPAVEQPRTTASYPSMDPDAPERPPVGNAPILWKEFYVGRRLLRPKLRTFLLLIGFIPFYIWTLRWAGYFGPDVINVLIRLLNSLFITIALATVALRSAYSLAAERDKQTLEGLLTTPLSLREILGGQWLASLSAPYWCYFTLAIIWTVGVLSDGLHGVAPFLLAVVVGSQAAFLASLGLAVAVRSQTAARAQMKTILYALIIFSGVPFWCIGLCFDAFYGTRAWEIGIALGQVPAVVLANVAISPDEFDNLPATTGPFLLGAVVNTILLAAGACFLWHYALFRFRRTCGRTDDFAPPHR